MATPLKPRPAASAWAIAVGIMLCLTGCRSAWHDFVYGPPPPVTDRLGTTEGHIDQERSQAEADDAWWIGLKQRMEDDEARKDRDETRQKREAELKR